ncbi:helix-turn-helix domain-containing protein [Lysinibacillus pakistanensis]|uniref:Helix-turn-helix transcriptional regulator n=1 Tax=Lysinibacillus pakistanensis TaxID=759811 RepID=A0AAX3X2T5_9BACI|nr:helix-turn-helix transcriptional regulator [Lysinibacillus pakistanensis]MDM5233501.1 helix-turn-helix transcriptional regulator [Lysinibacillus pakistanensis]WHY48973.1 helix-turn-helix transcriptional regulator [Lysinibacillus pakistanensis]WHY53984.1 helix-turn-helix transcriptional regulator [Lysinibacillus pakistanensis]
MKPHMIKALRSYYGLTQGEFASQVGFARTTISEVENMRKYPSAALLAAITRQFEITDEFVAFLRDFEKINGIIHNYTLTN